MFRFVHEHAGATVGRIFVDPGLSLGVQVLDVGNEFVHHGNRINQVWSGVNSIGQLFLKIFQRQAIPAVEFS